MKELRQAYQWERSLLLVSTILLLITFFTASTKSYMSKTAKKIFTNTQSLNVFVKPQPDSPLSMILVNPDSFAVRTPKVQVVLVNTSAKPINAYAIRYDTSDDGSKSGGLELSNKASLNSVLQPNQTEVVDVGEGIYQSEIKTIALSVDFVEFIDGTRWGPDTYRSGERLNGLRAGAQATISYFLKVLRNKGPKTVMEVAVGEVNNILPPPDHSPEWLEGFRQGTGIIRGHLNQSYKDHGLTEIESVLRKPVDALESRRVQ